MPEIIALLPCEKVVVDIETKNPTVISVLTKFNIQILEGQVLPDDAVAPKEWAVFTMWRPSDEEVGQSFTQVMTISSPSGKPAPEKLPINVTFEEKGANGIVVARTNGLPIGKSGHVVIRVWLEQHGQRVTEDREARFEVAHIVTSPSVPVTAPQA
jgi:hypothetical protein